MSDEQQLKDGEVETDEKDTVEQAGDSGELSNQPEQVADHDQSSTGGDQNAEPISDEPENTPQGDTEVPRSEQTPPEEAVPGEIPETGIHAFDSDDIDLTEVESQLQSLVPAVIEMTEHVTQASELNKEFRVELEQERTLTNKAVKQYQAMLDKQKKTMAIIVSASIAVLLIGCGVIGITAASYSKQSNNMNAMSLALSKRITEVSSGLATFEQINQSLAAMQQSIERLQLDSELMRNEYAAFQTENRSLLDDSLSSINENFVARTQALSERFAMAETEYQSTKESLTQASEAISGLRGRVDNASSKADQLLSLQEALDALVVLERERYLEQLQAQLQQSSDGSLETNADNVEIDDGLIQYSRSGTEASAVESRR